MKYFLFCFLALAAFSGCKKNKGLKYTVQGVVTDASFNTPASGVTVMLYKTAAGGAQELAETTVTGSDGSYTFTIEREKTEGYKIDYSKNNYFSGSFKFTLEDLDSKTTNSYNVSITAKSWVRLIFENDDPDQGVVVARTEGLTGCAECCPFSSISLSGITDTSFVCLNTANTPYGYSWIYSGGTVYQANSVITVPLDTTDMVLNF